MSERETAWYWLWDELARRLGADEAAALRQQLTEHARDDQRRKNVAKAPRQLAQLRQALATATSDADRRRWQKMIERREQLLREDEAAARPKSDDTP